MSNAMFTDFTLDVSADIDPANDLAVGVDISTNDNIKITWQNLINALFATVTPTGGTATITGIISATSFNGAGTGLTGTAAALNIGGNAATVTTNANLIGDVTSVGNTSTIPAGTVTLAKMANLATAHIMGRATAGTGVPESLTGTQVTALLDTFTTLKGLVPGVAVPSGQFLKDDGTFATPAGAGTVTTLSIVSANGFAGSVANPTSTPAVTLTTTITGLLKGNGTAISAATAGTDYSTASAVETLTNKTYDTAGTGNSFLINGVAATANTGTGAIARAVSPSFTTPILGTPTSGILTSCTGLPVSTGISGFGANVATFLATPSSANLLAAVTDESGTGNLLFSNSPVMVTPTLGTPVSGNLTNCTTDGTNALGYLGAPQVSKSTNYTFVLADAGKSYLHPSSDANARTFTIDSNANVAYPAGTIIAAVNQTSQVLSIAITTDTLTLANSTTTGTRSVAQNGICILYKADSTHWIAYGPGVT